LNQRKIDQWSPKRPAADGNALLRQLIAAPAFLLIVAAQLGLTGVIALSSFVAVAQPHSSFTAWFVASAFTVAAGSVCWLVTRWLWRALGRSTALVIASWILAAGTVFTSQLTFAVLRELARGSALLGMNMSPMLSEILKEGFVVTRCERSELDATLHTMGTVIQRERVVLREGGHAYLSKPGRVSLHTDHPQAQLIAWFCEEQDHDDGANHLLDSRPVVLGLSESSRRTLRMMQLECPCGTRPGGSAWRPHHCWRA
jgi:hypothetical protein